MVRALFRQDAERLSLRVGLCKVAEGVVGKRDMFQARGGPYSWAGVWYRDNGDAVVLFIVAEECQGAVFVGDFGAEEISVESTMAR